MGLNSGRLHDAVTQGELTAVEAQLSAKANKALGAVITPTLLNGWAVFNGLTPKYRMDDMGRITFYGSIASGSAGTVAFVLESTHRPTMDHLVMVRSSSGTYSALLISPNGNVTVQTLNTYLSFDGLDILRSWS